MYGLNTYSSQIIVVSTNKSLFFNRPQWHARCTQTKNPTGCDLNPDTTYVSIVPPALPKFGKAGRTFEQGGFMKKRFSIFIGIVALLTSAGLVLAQEDPGDEYEEWQKAKREEAREHREYLNNPKKSNYLDWRSAQRDANREWEEYKLSLEMVQGYPYPRRNVIVVGQAQPVRRTVVVAENRRYINGNGTKVVYANGNGKYVNGTKVAYVNGNGRRAYVNGGATCGTGAANRAVYISAAMDGNGFDEFEEWAAAEREVAREHREFLNNPTDDNFAGWKEAQVDACREYAEYRGSTSSVAYTTAAYSAPVVRTTYVRRRAPVRRVRARAKRCVCR